MAVFLLKGILIGLVCGAPVGAAGAMVIQRTLKFGVKQGLLSGLGSSLADCIFACIGAFGLTLVSDFLSRHSSVINILGGAIVILMGLSMCRKKEIVQKHRDGWKYFLTTFSVAITNPFAIVAFIIGFSYMNIDPGVGALGSIMAVLGVFTGTSMWWLLLTYITHLAKKKSRQDILNKINIILSAALVILGAVMVIKGALSLIGAHRAGVRIL